MDSKLKFEDWIGRWVEVVIDRPMGTSHPDYSDIVYPVNYGYIPRTTAPDGNAIDATCWVRTVPLGGAQAWS